MAIEEAFLAERGFTEKLIADINMAAGNVTYDESILRGFQEATVSNQYLDYHFLSQASCLEVFAFYLQKLFECNGCSDANFSVLDIFDVCLWSGNNLMVKLKILDNRFICPH